MAEIKVSLKIKQFIEEVARQWSMLFPGLSGSAI